MTMRDFKETSLFILATTSPGITLNWAAYSGGWSVLIAFLHMTLLVTIMDAVMRPLMNAAGNKAIEFPAHWALSYALVILQMMTMFHVSIAIASGMMSPLTAMLLFLATGLFLGQIVNANAHELIHRTARWPFFLGRSSYAALLYGHHASAHRLVHHIHVATPDDPATARFDEGFYAYFQRAWLENYRKGYRMETARLTKRDGAHPGIKHPYFFDAGMSLIILAVVGYGGGGAAVLIFILLALYAQVQLMLSDYVQHYGLLRQKRSNGKYQPVGLAHSWNAPQRYSGAMMLHAPRHSEHHTSPARPFVELQLPNAAAAPELPFGLPAMCTIALFPSLWRHMMNRRVREWRNENV